jgi:4-aminobutyrate aminotransferase-like enzyme/GNAT superfamily N-acetyltransferase
LYAGDFVAKEKKPQVIDTRRCSGPYLVSVDDEPMVLLDACAQIATLTHSFAHPTMLAAVHEGRFDPVLWSNPDASQLGHEVLENYAKGLIERAPAGLEHVAFCVAGGAEANEKAFRIARMHAPDQKPERRRVLAFQQGFHGRTLVSLGATWNPVKRGPFEFEGFEAVFAEPTLESVRKILEERGHEIYAAIIEPMMAEGGDVHLAKEFVLGLRQLTREAGIPLIADEVQTGFFTGTPFFWWKKLGLGDSAETAPDMITCAKKAQMGLVVSRWPDPEPSAPNLVSALRGLIHLERAGDQAYLHQAVEGRLAELAGTFPNLVANPRVAGTTFAFDLPDADARSRFIDQRFRRGFMTYQAGESTIRFRLSAGWSERELDDLFLRVGRALAMLDDEERLTWVAEGERREVDASVVVSEIAEEDWPEIMTLENATYEAERADSEEHLRKAAAAGVGFVARDASGELLGFCFGGRIEKFLDVVGPDRDRFAQPLGEGGVAFYSADVSVASEARGRGVGRALKQAQLDWARARDFRFVSGRNRVGATPEMAALNRAMGAYVVARFDNQYGGDAQADYYRIALRAPALPKHTRHVHNLASGLQQPFGTAPDFMSTRELVGPLVNRLNLSNWATIDAIHYSEHLREILPRGCSHMYITSSRDELVDKALRCFRLSRPEGQYAISLEGGYVGHVSAASRALSDAEGFGEHFDLFGWPQLPHPALAGIDATVTALEAVLAERGANAALAFVVEIFGERSGLVLDDEALEALNRVCRKHDVPFVVSETTTGGYRNAAGAWAVDSLPTAIVPDMVLWYPGGQLGHIFVGDRYWIGKPLTLISTWDGDEISMIRTHEALRASWKIDFAAPVEALTGLAGKIASGLGGRAAGRGLAHAVRCEPEKAEAFIKAAETHGVVFGRGAPGVIRLLPALDIEADALNGEISAAVDAALGEVAG